MKLTILARFLLFNLAPNLRINVLGKCKNTLQPAVCLLLTLVFTSPLSWGMSLSQAILRAQQHDPWLDGSQQKERALQSQGMAADTLDNPELSFGVLNVPSDGFAFDQEPMTQFKVGIKQTFTRGESRTITRQRFNQLAAAQPLLRDDRRKQITQTITLLWLDLHYAKQRIALATEQSEVLQELIDIAQSHYASVYTKGRKQITQNDVLSARLDKARLADRIAQLHINKRTMEARLCQWLVDDNLAKAEPSVKRSNINRDAGFDDCALATDTASSMPLLATLPALLTLDGVEHANKQGVHTSFGRRNAMLDLVAEHPRVNALQQSVTASQSDVKLAKTQYDPQWGVNASYAYRQDDQFNSSRADFWSLGVSVDLPLFSHQKQDSLLAATHHQKEALKTDYRLLVRKMIAELDELSAQYQLYSQRIKHYEQVILPNLIEQKEVSTANLSHDYASLDVAAEVAVIELDAKLALLDLRNEQQKIQVKMNYFLPNKSPRSFHEVGSSSKHYSSSKSATSPKPAASFGTAKPQPMQQTTVLAISTTVPSLSINVVNK